MICLLMKCLSKTLITFCLLALIACLHAYSFNVIKTIVKIFSLFLSNHHILISLCIKHQWNYWAVSTAISLLAAISCKYIYWLKLIETSGELLPFFFFVTNSFWCVFSLNLIETIGEVMLCLLAPIVFWYAIETFLRQC